MSPTKLSASKQKRQQSASKQKRPRQQSTSKQKRPKQKRQQSASKQTSPRHVVFLNDPTQKKSFLNSERYKSFKQRLRVHKTKTEKDTAKKVNQLFSRGTCLSLQASKEHFRLMKALRAIKTTTQMTEHINNAVNRNSFVMYSTNNPGGHIEAVLQGRFIGDTVYLDTIVRDIGTAPPGRGKLLINNLRKRYQRVAKRIELENVTGYIPYNYTRPQVAHLPRVTYYTNFTPIGQHSKVEWIYPSV